jgi:hypothetical protein
MQFQSGDPPQLMGASGSRESLTILAVAFGSQGVETLEDQWVRFGVTMSGDPLLKLGGRHEIVPDHLPPGDPARRSNVRGEVAQRGRECGPRSGVEPDLRIGPGRGVEDNKGRRW